MDIRTYTRTVPNVGGNFCVVDIEAVKVPAENWPIRTRFKPFMVGIGAFRVDTDLFVTRVAESDNEAELIAWVEFELAPFSTWAFAASRDWDKNVFEGRWTYARRALADAAGPWPTLRPSERWFNIRKEFKNAGRVDRSSDPFFGKSEEILKWPDLDRDLVFNHCRLDVEEMAVGISFLVRSRSLPSGFTSRLYRG